jgi:hypothetical protein
VQNFTLFYICCMLRVWDVCNETVTPSQLQCSLRCESKAAEEIRLLRFRSAAVGPVAYGGLRTRVSVVLTSASYHWRHLESFLSAMRWLRGQRYCLNAQTVQQLLSDHDEQKALELRSAGQEAPRQGMQQSAVVPTTADQAARRLVLKEAEMLPVDCVGRRLSETRDHHEKQKALELRSAGQAAPRLDMQQSAVAPTIADQAARRLVLEEAEMLPADCVGRRLSEAVRSHRRHLLWEIWAEAFVASRTTHDQAEGAHAQAKRSEAHRHLYPWPHAQKNNCVVDGSSCAAQLVQVPPRSQSRPPRSGGSGV